MRDVVFNASNILRLWHSPHAHLKSNVPAPRPLVYEYAESRALLTSAPPSHHRAAAAAPSRAHISPRVHTSRACTSRAQQQQQQLTRTAAGC